MGGDCHADHAKEVGKRWGDVSCTTNHCALAGAAAFFAGIPEAKIVANGPLWCYFYALRRIERGTPEISMRYFCSQVDHSSIIYGTEDTLLETLENVKRSGEPSVLLIENSCAIGLIGDDLAGIARAADMNCPVVCLDTGGLTGGFFEGYRAAAQAYFRAMPMEKGEKRPRSVNLLGAGIIYDRGSADLRVLSECLEDLGIEIVAAVGANSSVEALKKIPEAKLNIVLSEELGGELAQEFEKNYGMKYIAPPLPYGIEGTREWLLSIVTALGMEKELAGEIERRAEEMRAALNAGLLELSRTWGDLWYERAVIAAPYSVALGLARALREEFADIGELSVFAYGTKGKQQKRGEGIERFYTQEEIHALPEFPVKLSAQDLLLGSSQEQVKLSERGKIPLVFLPIAQPVQTEARIVSRPFMGFEGALNFAEKLWNKTLCVREITMG